MAGGAAPGAATAMFNRNLCVGGIDCHLIFERNHWELHANSFATKVEAHVSEHVFVFISKLFDPI